jgi:hypothetical protein
MKDSDCMRSSQARLIYSSKMAFCNPKTASAILIRSMKKNIVGGRGSERPGGIGHAIDAD